MDYLTEATGRIECGLLLLELSKRPRKQLLTEETTTATTAAITQA